MGTETGYPRLRWLGGRLLRIVILPSVSVLFALLVAMLFLQFTGYHPVAVFRAILTQSFSDPYGLGQVLGSTTSLIFTGLAVALAFQAGLFNIGAEGQLYIGAIAVGIAGHYIAGISSDRVQSVPWWVWAAGFALLAMIAASLWGAIPGVLKATTGAHEVITTIMMNFVALALINFLLRPSPASFAVPATLHTTAIPRPVRIPRMSQIVPQFEGSTLNYTFFLAIAAAFSIYVLLRFTRLGFEIRAVGKNPAAARLAGISPAWITICAMALSGALAGLVGVDYVLGYKGYFQEGFSAGLGFLGIAVALLANNHPIGVLFTAFLFGVLSFGKVAAAGEIPKDIIEIMEAAIIFSVILGNSLFARILRRAQRRHATHQ